MNKTAGVRAMVTPRYYVKGAYEWGYCHVCKRFKRLTYKGLLFVHNLPIPQLSPNRKRCPMSGKEPRRMAVGKYGRPNHGPRCGCPDCQTSFLQHNRAEHCACYDCAQHREIGAPPPPVTTMAEQLAAQQEAREQERNAYNKFWNIGEQRQHEYLYVPKKEAETVSTIHMCSRENCNAIIKREALGVVSITTSPMANDTEQKNFELCPDCTRDIWELLHSNPSSVRQRAYDKPFRPEDENTKETEKLADEAALGKALVNLLRNNGLNVKAIEGVIHDGKTLTGTED